MKVPQIIMAVGLLVLAGLLLNPQRHAPTYNTASEVTIHGVIEDVQNFYCPISGDEGTHLIVATDNGEVQVHVAPSRFLSGQGWNFVKGEQVEVLGSRIYYREREALIARTITRGSQIVALRKANGRPLWLE